MVARGLIFGSGASDYERHRFGYPVDLVDRTLAYAGRPVRRALEIGAGTGKATRVFAEQGIAVTATDPDAAMLAELRAHVPSTVTVAQAAFEDLSPSPCYDLVFAAAAMHWTRPTGRWVRVAAHLVPGGVFAGFGGPIQLSDPEVEEAVRAARAPFLEHDGFPSPDETPPGEQMQWPGSELMECGLFADVRQSTLPRRFTLSALDYIGHLSTVSAYLELPPSVRRAAFARIALALPERVELTADIVLHLGRRAS